MIELDNLIVFRHGHSAHNYYNGRVLGDDCGNLEGAYQDLLRVSGEVGSDAHWPLTGRGIQQARFASEIIQAYVAPLNPVAFITSPYQRAVQTAHMVFPRVTWGEDTRIRERNWGDTTYGLQTVHDYRREHAVMFQRACTDPAYIPGKDGESVLSHAPLVYAALAELGSRYGNATVVLSSHGETSKIIRYVLAGANPAIWPVICEHTGMRNLSLIHFRKGPSGKLEDVRILNPLVHPMEMSGWQPILPT